MGHVRVAFGALDVESQCAWAVVQSYTAAELNNRSTVTREATPVVALASPPSPTLSSYCWASETVRGETVV